MRRRARIVKLRQGGKRRAFECTKASSLLLHNGITVVDVLVGGDDGGGLITVTTHQQPH